MWVKLKGSLYNLSLVQAIYKEKNTEILLYYRLEQGEYEDYSTIKFNTEKERDVEFERIEKMLLGEKICNSEN